MGRSAFRNEKRLGSATPFYKTDALSFVIPTGAEGPAVPRTSLGNVFRQRVAISSFFQRSPKLQNSL
jgi:hypothetical protein